MDFPLAFIENAGRLLGETEAGRLLAALRGQPVVSIRINHLKCRQVPGAVARLARVPWCDSGYYLEQRPAFTFDPLLHAGCYYVQEASSMFLEQAVRRYLPSEAAVAALDLCAAPGGKSTHLCSLLPQGSLLVANEVVRNRAQVLAENLAKWGCPGVIVSNNDPADFTRLDGCFDLVLVDAPCSGEGMFRKDPASIAEWSEANVDLCQQRQRKILEDIWPCLKPGGILIYSTCTYNLKENEENVDWIREHLGGECLPLEVPEEWQVTGNLLPGGDFPVYRFMPHHTQGEGFFLAVLRKTAGGAADGGGGEAAGGRCKLRRQKNKERVKTRPSLFSKEQLAKARSWLVSPDDYEWTVGDDGVLLALPCVWKDLYATLAGTLRLLSAGVAVAQAKGRELSPCHALAMCTALADDAFPTVQLTYGQAVAYLRKEAVILPDEAPRGFVRIAYQGFSLGFVKNVGNRANNLYPQAWRIRSGYVPENASSLWQTGE